MIIFILMILIIIAIIILAGLGGGQAGQGQVVAELEYCVSVRPTKGPPKAHQPLPVLPQWLGLGQGSADLPYHGLPIARVRPAPLPLDRPKPPLLLESLLGLTPRKDESQFSTMFCLQHQR